MKSNAKKTLSIYLKTALNYKGLAFLLMLSVILATSAGLVSALFIAQFFNQLSAGPAGAGVIEALLRLLLFFALFEGLGWLFWRVSNFSSTYFFSRALFDLDNRSFQYLHQHSFSFFNNNFVGSLVKRLKWFSRAFEIIADQVIWHLLPLVANIVLIVVILFSRSYLLALAVLVWSVLFLLVNFIFSRYKLKYDIRKAKKETETTGLLADTITNNQAVKLFNGYRRETKGFSDISSQLKKLRQFTWNLDNVFEAVQGILMISLEVGILYLALRLWQKSILEIGDFVLIQLYLIRIFHRVWDFGRVLRRIYASLADAEEMTIILDTPHEIVDIPQAKNLKVQKGEIEFKNVDFCYHQTRKVLDNFNLKIAPQERAALVGPSGAGKTTAVRLLLRMGDVSAGRILIDGRNIAKVKQESLRRQISFVPQNPILFHRSLLDNIGYGRPRASGAAVVEAAKKARAHHFINNLPEGYNTYVGERGIKLSGGERQRVAIARAILRNAPILVLDEATSSLDSASEKLIQEAMKELMKNKTVIVIAHRLSTISKMNRIIVIDKGRIIELKEMKASR